MSLPRVDTLELPVVRRDERPEPVPQQWQAAASPRGPRRWPRRLVATTLLVGAAAAGVAVGLQRPGGPLSAQAVSDGDVVAVSAQSVESFDPTGGSGFVAGEEGWRTQTYTTAEFGNLKDGVGLLLDLGEPRALASVTLHEATPGLPVELRAADSDAGDVEDFQVVTSTETAAGVTALEAGDDAGEARYWLVWVSGLAPSDDGFGAEIGEVTLEARS